MSQSENWGKKIEYFLSQNITVPAVLLYRNKMFLIDSDLLLITFYRLNSRFEFHAFRMTELNHAFGILELRIFVLTLHSLGIVIMLLLLGLIRRW